MTEKSKDSVRCRPANDASAACQAMNDANCPICQAQLTRGIERISDPESGECFSVPQCTKCRLGVTMPVPSDLSRYYGHDYHGGRHGITTGLCDRRRIRILEGCCKGGRLLDIGCGDGTFLRAAVSNGWSVYGVEKYPERARRLGLSVFEKLDEAKAVGPFQCVTLWHCLEHLPEPEQALNTIRQMLTDDGSVIVAVPHASSRQARLLGRHWLHLDVPRHLFHFSACSLQRLAESQGLVARRLPYTELEYDLMGWTQGVLNMLFHERDLFFRIVTGKKTRAWWPQKVTCVAVGVIVCALASLPAALGAITGRGGTLIMELRKHRRSGSG